MGEIERLTDENKELKEQVQEKDTEKSEVSKVNTARFYLCHEKTCLWGF